jgi:hypothetical protein
MQMENLSSPHPRYCTRLDEIAMHKKVVAELDVQISGLENEIRVLTSRLQLLQRKRATHLSYTAPLNCLPVEILVEIFTICVENGVKARTLSQICSRLRNFILKTPVLWRYIDLSLQNQELNFAPGVYVSMPYLMITTIGRTKPFIGYDSTYE